MQRVIVVLLFVLAIPCFGGNLDKKFPPLEDLVRHGCSISGPIQMANRKDPLLRLHAVWVITLWAAHGTAEKSEKDWILVYSYRKSRKKGYPDCERFMTRMKKYIAAGGNK